MKRLLLCFSMTIVFSWAFAQRYVGGDISLLPTYEANGAKYYDKDGSSIGDMLKFLKQLGLNSMRVRLFVDPTKATTAEKGQGVRQNLEYVKALGKRIKEAGFTLMLDFHYSDSWADPGNQWTPASWQSMTDAQLQSKIYEYTKDCLKQMATVGATPDFIQTGNEISYGMMWGARNTQTNRCYYNSSDANWNRFFALLRKAGEACREVCPNAKIVLHSERVPKTDVLKDFFDRVKTQSIDYDMIGLSYYPYHHGYLQQLETALSILEKNYDKDIMIVETGYYYAWYPNDVSYNYTATYPATPAGQQAFTKALVETLKKYDRVKGLYWWFMEACENGLDWNTKRVTDSWYNASLFNDSNTSDVGYGAGCAMPALYELKAFIEDASGIRNAVVNNQDQYWYNLQGLRFDTRPQDRGVYIVGDRKVIIN